MNNIKKFNLPIISITMGDPAGIGPEIIVKAFENNNFYNRCIPIIVGSFNVLEKKLIQNSYSFKLNIIKEYDKSKIKKDQLNFWDLDNIDFKNIDFGKAGPHTGRASIEYVNKAIELAINNNVDGIVTCPINKKAINMAGYKYSGHTELLAEKTNTNKYAMMLSHKDLRVIHVSTHVSLRNACDLVRKNRIYNVICLGNNILKKIGIPNPNIVVLGLNPHAGESGLFGNEEEKEIIPAINKARKENINVEGPLPADTAFSKVITKKYDLVVVMYHDQGHIPIKLYGSISDKNDSKTEVRGVNITTGLPIVRTSVDHGTAFDIVGKNIADEGSLVDAIEFAIKLTKS